MRKLNYIFIVCLLSLAGCSTLVPEGKVIERNGFSAIQNPPGIKMAILKKEGDTERICAPREADFAETQSAGVGVGLAGVGGANEHVGEQSAQGALALGGRDPSVLILREMTYRACELALNTNASKKETLAIYMQFLEVAQKMIKGRLGGGSAVAASSAKTISIPSAPIISNSDNAEEASSDSDDPDASSTCAKKDFDVDGCVLKSDANSECQLSDFNAGNCTKY